MHEEGKKKKKWKKEKPNEGKKGKTFQLDTAFSIFDVLPCRVKDPED